jgi:hypothetical protein
MERIGRNNGVVNPLPRSAEGSPQAVAMQMPVKNPLYRIPGKDLGDLGYLGAVKGRRIVEKTVDLLSALFYSALQRSFQSKQFPLEDLVISCSWIVFIIEPAPCAAKSDTVIKVTGIVQKINGFNVAHIDLIFLIEILSPLLNTSVYGSICRERKRGGRCIAAWDIGCLSE